MSGQSANLTLKEACAMQHRVQHSGSHANTNGGKSSSKAEAAVNPKKSTKY